MYIIHTKMEGRLILDVIARKCATILKLFTGVQMSHCRSGRVSFLFWILALTLLIVSEDLTSRAICLIHYLIGMDVQLICCPCGGVPTCHCPHCPHRQRSKTRKQTQDNVKVKIHKVKIQDKKVRQKFIFTLYIFLVAYPIDMHVCS